MVPRVALAGLLLTSLAFLVPPASATCTWIGGAPGTADLYECNGRLYGDVGSGCLVASPGAENSSGPGWTSKSADAQVTGSCVNGGVGAGVSDTATTFEGTTCVWVDPVVSRCWTRNP